MLAWVPERAFLNFPLNTYNDSEREKRWNPTTVVKKTSTVSQAIARIWKEFPLTRRLMELDGRIIMLYLPRSLEETLFYFPLSVHSKAHSKHKIKEVPLFQVIVVFVRERIMHVWFPGSTSLPAKDHNFWKAHGQDGRSRGIMKGSVIPVTVPTEIHPQTCRTLNRSRRRFHLTPREAVKRLENIHFKLPNIPI